MVRGLSKHQSAFLFDCCVFIARFASSSCYSSAKTRIRPVKSYHEFQSTTHGHGSSTSLAYQTYYDLLIHAFVRYDKTKKANISKRRNVDNSNIDSTDVDYPTDVSDFVPDSPYEFPLGIHLLPGLATPPNHHSGPNLNNQDSKSLSKGMMALSICHHKYSNC